MKTLGFIVPIYNVKKEWIKKCIDSLITISDYTDDFEVIVVENGSTDKSIWPWLKKHYENKYSFLSLKRFNVNNGKKQSTAYGLKYLKTKYVQVVDSDDWIISEKVPRVIKILNLTNGELYFLNYIYYSERKQQIRGERKILAYKGDFKLLKKVPRMMWHFDTNTIINREFMVKNKFRFPKEIKYYEDTYINMWNLSKATFIFYINEAMYMYRINLDGINLSSMNKFMENINYFKNMLDTLENLSYENPVTQKHMLYFFSNQITAFCFFKLLQSNDFFAKRIYTSLLNEVKKNNLELYKLLKSKNPKNFNILLVTFWGGYNPFIKPVGKLINRFRN